MDRRSLLLPGLLAAAALAINLSAIGWGLPNGNYTWAADSIRPGAPLSIIYRTFISDPVNSGWFWFKYPPGHVFIIAAAYAPYMAWLWVSGGIVDPGSSYPYGMTDPEGTLATLAIIGRLLSALMGTGCVLLVFATLRNSFGRGAATAAAALTALSYPMVYYSHTTNVEIPYLFWMLLALLAATRLLEGQQQRRWWVLLALGAAMSVSSKELGAGVFLALPPVVAVYVARNQGVAALVRGGLIAAVALVVTMVAANNIALNPSGFLNRVGFLTHTLPAETALEYAPYYFPIDLGVARGWATELAQLKTAGRQLTVALGWPALVLAVAGLFLAARQRPAWTLMLVGAGLGFYLLGLRAMLSMSLRYVMPLSLLACLPAGIALARVASEGRGAAVRRVVAGLLCLYMAAYGLDVCRMLGGDGRYRAEAWLEANLSDGQRVETYQRPTYLPRLPAKASHVAVDFYDRSIEGLRNRDPDYIVLSSAGIAGFSVKYSSDWTGPGQDSDQWVANQVGPGGQVLNYKRRANVQLLAGITDGSLGYSEVGRFVVDPWIDRPLIQSLNPEITIYARARP